MAIQLSQDDFDRLAGTLSQHDEWQSIRDRIDFMADVLPAHRAGPTSWAKSTAQHFSARRFSSYGQHACCPFNRKAFAQSALPESREHLADLPF